MLLAFRDAVNLRTKKIIFEEQCCDSTALQLLKDLSSKRRAIEESIDKRTNKKEANNEEMAKLNSQCLERLEEYLPHLADSFRFMSNREHGKKPELFHSWIINVKVQWSSAMTSCDFIQIGGPKFFHSHTLLFELEMSLFLYRTILRERAYGTISKDIVESATLFRKAAGVYSYMAEKVCPYLRNSFTKGNTPVEATAPLCSIMSLICLADAQAVTIMKGEEKKSSQMLLSKLHYGIAQLMEEATSVIAQNPKVLQQLSAKVKEFISTCKVLHELRSQRCLAVEHRSKELIGIGILVLRQAMSDAKKAKPTRNEQYNSVLSQEIADTDAMLKKFEHENDFVWHKKIPGILMLPSLEGKKIVCAISYEPPELEVAVEPPGSDAPLPP